MNEIIGEFNLTVSTKRV